MAQISRSGDLTSGPMLQKIILFSLPLAASSILQLLFNAADVVTVGRFAGSTALAAVGSNGALINLLVNLFVGLSLGANVVAARCFGARDDQGVQNTVHTAVTLGLVSGVLLAGVGFFVARGLLELMSSPEDVIDLATLYLKIYFLGMPMTMLYNFSSALLRAVGDTKRPLFCLATAGVINVILNLVFVIGFQMSVAGVALATIVFIALLISSSYGRAFKAIREDEIAAESMGVSLLRHKMLSFMLSAFLAAVGGGLFASYIATIGPDVFQVSRTYDILMIVVMGGMGSISGSVLAAFIVTIGQEWLRVLDGPLPFLPFWPENGVSGMRMVVFSVLLLIIILFFRNGLFGHNEVTWSSIGRRLKTLSGHGREVSGHE